MPEKKVAKDNSTSLTVFEHIDRAAVIDAISNLISGKTPKKDIKERQLTKGGKTVPYVNTYYMTRQISLITGFRWSSECLEERVFPNIPGKPIQYFGAKMRVTIWDKQGNKFYQESWGEKPVTEGVGHFDQWKAAYSDGIKKCLSYFGIANDVYGNKDLQFFGEEPPETVVEEVEIIDDIEEDRIDFRRFIKGKDISEDSACKILDIKGIDDIVDFTSAKVKIAEWYNKQY